MRNKMYLAYIAVVIYVAAFSLILVSCGANKERVLGRWQSVSTGETIEFFEDGKVVIEAGYSQKVGNYNVNEDGRLRIDLPGWFGTNSAAFDLEFSGNTMTIKGGDSSFEFRKIK